MLHGGRVHDGWRRAKLGQICEISIGRTPARKRPEYWDRDKITSNRWVTIADMRDANLADTAEYISDLGAKESGARRVPAGTPLMSFKLTVGRVAVAAVPVYTNEAIAAFLTNGDIDRSFLLHALPTLALTGEVDQAVKGQTLNTRKLRQIDVLLPPIAEQRRIAAILSSVDEAIERTETVIARVRDVKRALAQELLTRGMPGRHTRFKQTAVGEIPEEWEVVRVGDLAKFTSGAPISVQRLREESTADPIPVYGGNGIAGFTNHALVQTASIVVGRVGQRCGVVALAEGPAWVTDNALYPASLQRELDIEFFALVLEAARLNDVRNRNDLPLVTQAIVHGVKVAWPPDLTEQHAIASAIARVDVRSESEEATGTALQEIKASLSSALLLGQVRVRNNGAT